MSRRKQYRPVRVQEEDDKINDNIKSGAITTRPATNANNSTIETTATTTTTEDEKGASSSNVVKSIITETTKITTTKTIPNVLQTSVAQATTKTLKKLIENKFVNENNVLLASQLPPSLTQERPKYPESFRDLAGDEINGKSIQVNFFYVDF